MSAQRSGFITGMDAEGKEYDIPSGLAQELDAGEDIGIERDGRSVTIVSWKPKAGEAGPPPPAPKKKAATKEVSLVGVDDDDNEYPISRKEADALDAFETASLTLPGGKEVVLVSYFEDGPGEAPQVLQGKLAKRKAKVQAAAKKPAKKQTAKKTAAPKPPKREPRCHRCGTRTYGHDHHARCGHCENFFTEAMHIAERGLLEGISPNITKERAEIIARSARLVADAMLEEWAAPLAGDRPHDEDDAGADS